MLLSNLNLIASAPNGVARLRELILTLAVQGKLVPQNPQDEPASELLKRIRVEKDKLIAEGKIKRDKPLAPITDKEKPFELPEGWEWANFGDVIDIVRGITFPATEKTREAALGRIACLRTSNVQKNIEWSDLLFIDRSFMSREDQLIKHHDIVMSMANSRELVGKVALIEHIPYSEATFGGFLGVLRPREINPRYAMVVLRTSYARALLIDSSSQTTNIANVSLAKLRPLLIPLPPLAEQSRIVTRVEELMRLCDALENNQKLESAQHAQLVRTLLDTLTASASPEELAQNWERVATHFYLLFNRPAAVDALEQTILQLAVRGLLVPQNTEDEPASVFILRLMQHNANSSKKQHLKKEDKLYLSPYELPKSWMWVQLGNIIKNMGSGWSPACNEGARTDSKKWAVLRTTAVQINEYRACEHKTIPINLKPRPEIEVKKGDILITRAGPINRVGISCWVDNTPQHLMLSDKIVRFNSIADEILPAFIVLALNVGCTKKQIEAAKSGMAASQVNISQTDIRNLWIPVCSKSEQSRIVARVEQLRQLCAQLRGRLVEGQKVQEGLAGWIVTT